MTFENVPIRMNGKSHAEKLKYNRQESLGILFQSLKKKILDEKFLKFSQNSNSTIFISHLCKCHLLKLCVCVSVM